MGLVHPASVVGSRKPLWERILPEKLLSREFPAPSLGMFVVLQTLDVLTTLIGLRVAWWARWLRCSAVTR